jgi:asparagine synthase (glutamine-hydrolysing)
MDAEALLDSLRKSVRKDIDRAAKVAVAYSGGIDSSVIAALASEQAEVNCYTWAVEGSFDAANAQTRAREEDLNVSLNLLQPARLRSAVASASTALGSTDPVPISYAIPLILVLEESPEKIALAGNGADELFGGYSKYASAGDPSAVMRSDLSKTLREADALKRWTETTGKRLCLPFISDDVINLSNDMPMSWKIRGGERKVVLREVAKLLKLPSHDRPKKAAQYSSGTLKLMKRTAKTEELSLVQWTERCARITRQKRL